MSSVARFGFIVSADTAEEAEELRQYVIEKLDASHFAEWYVEDDVSDFGDEEEQ